MSYVKASAALMQAVKDLNTNTLHFSNVRWPNTELTPPPTDPWMTVDMIPDPQPAVATLGNLGEDEHRGILQLGLYFPLQKGHKDLNEIYEAIRTYFVAGKFLTYDTARVRVLQCGMTPPTRIDSNFTSFATIYWLARFARPSIL